jgi:hypothetical protein
MDRSTTEDGRQPLIRNRTLPLGWIAGTADLRAAMSVIVLATVGIIVTGLPADRKGTK